MIRRLNSGNRWRGAMPFALSMMVAGCVTTTVTPPRRTVPGADNADPMSADHAVASDPCAARLHEIAGAMLEYYAINRALPERLDDLMKLQDLDTPLTLTCPVSKQPYLYTPAGLETPGGTKRIILYDALPSHDGARWCMLMAPSGAAAAKSMEVLLIPESVFRTYLQMMP